MSKQGYYPTTPLDETGYTLSLLDGKRDTPNPPPHLNEKGTLPTLLLGETGYLHPPPHYWNRVTHYPSPEWYRGTPTPSSILPSPCLMKKGTNLPRYWINHGYQIACCTVRMEAGLHRFYNWVRLFGEPCQPNTKHFASTVDSKNRCFRNCPMHCTTLIFYIY